MNILIKFLLKNILENKLRTFLILLSVALVGALFFATMATSDTMAEVLLNKIKQYFGTADLLIYPNAKSPAPYLNPTKAARYQEQLEYIVTGIRGNASFKNGAEYIQFDLRCFDLAKLQQMNPFSLKKGAQTQPFAGHQIIISNSFATKYGLQIGGKIDLLINQTRHRFIIVGLANNEGPFQSEGFTKIAILPRKTGALIFNTGNNVSAVFLKLKDPSGVARLIKLLQKDYSRYDVKEPLAFGEVDEFTGTITTSMFLMLILVTIMSIFIIYTSFKVITMERLPFIGTFRSVGATKAATNLVLLGESLLYGIIGGLAGLLLGFGVLYLITKMLLGFPSGQSALTLSFSLWQMASAFLLAVGLAFVSSLFPIIKTAKIPLKELILRKLDSAGRKETWRLPVGLILLGITLGFPLINFRPLILYANLISLLTAVATVIILAPLLTRGAVLLLEKSYLFLWGNEGLLAIKNIRNNKSNVNNITLLAIGISSLLMINTLSSSVLTEIINLFKDAQFQIWLNTRDGDRSLESKLHSIAGVKETYGVYKSTDVAVANHPGRIALIHGVNSYKFPHYWNFYYEESHSRLFRRLEAGRNIIITHTLKGKFGVAKGDILILKTKRGERPYRVIGFFNSMMYTGSYALVSQKYLKSDMKLNYYGSVFIKTTKDPRRVTQTIRKRLRDKKPFVMAVADLQQRDLESNQTILLILQGFSGLAMLIGICGVFNNFLISFMERRRALAMMRSVGMSKKQAVKIIIIEALTIGLIGGAAGVGTGLLLIAIIPRLLIVTIEILIRIHYSLSAIICAVVGGVLIAIIASISPALKSSRINLIEAIKYE